MTKLIREAGCIVPLPTRRQALEQGRRVQRETGSWPAGICRICGCTQFSACLDEYGDACGWLDEGHSVCDTIACAAKMFAETEAV